MLMAAATIVTLMKTGGVFNSSSVGSCSFPVISVIHITKTAKLLLMI